LRKNLYIICKFDKIAGPDEGGGATGEIAPGPPVQGGPP